MSNKILHFALWLLFVCCLAACIYFALHAQYMEAGMFVLSTGQSACNLILFKDIKK